MTKQNKATKTQTNQNQLGFGSNIRSSRLARAALNALRQHKYAAALDYAARAAHSAPNDPQLWLLFGYTARLSGKYQQSVTAFKHALSLDPSSLKASSGLAQTYSVMGRTKEAEQILKSVVAKNPKQVDDLLILGNLYLNDGNYSQAAATLEQANRLKPSARSELLLAIAYEHLHKMPLAEKYLNAAKRRAPHNPDVKRSLAQYYISTRNYSGAIDQLKSIRSPSPDVVGELAYTYKLAGKLNESAKLYARAANHAPQNLSLQIAAARSQLAVHSLHKAQPFLDRAASINANDYRLHVMRAEIARTQGHDQKAAQEYNAALANLPKFPSEGPLYRVQLHMDLKRLYASLDQSDKSQQQLAQARREISALHVHGPQRAAFLRLRSLIALNSGNPTSALHDVKESLSLSPNDPNSLMLEGQVFTSLKRIKDAVAAYKRALAIEPRNQFALTSLGYASRAEGNNQQAEKYFHRLARYYPSLYVPYLALGDLYTSRKNYKKAQAYYAKAYTRAPHKPAIIAGGINAGIEEHNLKLADTWMQRVTDQMKSVPRVMAQQERYYNLKGRYQESAELGRKAIQYFPHDRDVIVYLGYDLLRLRKFDELKTLTTKYMDVLPNEPDIPLLAGYVYEHDGKNQLAINQFTEAIHRNPDVVTAYVNRGYLLNNMDKPKDAASDFQQAIRREPHNGKAHLGLAFSELALNHSGAAIRQSNIAEKLLGDSQPLHVIRATAYGREGLYAKAATEYQAALRVTPNNGSLHLGLGNIYFSEHRYDDAIQQLNSAQKTDPKNAQIYALKARSYAHLQNRPQALQAVQLAEHYASQMPVRKRGPHPADIYVATGEAFRTLGDRQAAMQRFGKALVLPGSNRVHVRLAIARLMAKDGETEQAERQIALAQMESEAGVTSPITGSQYLQAASIFQQLHEFQLAQNYLEHAQKAGAPELKLHVALANNYLALGETSRAAAQLAAARRSDRSQGDYSFLLAQANVEAQQQHSAQAVSTFAHAASASGGNQVAEDALLTASGNEGYPINHTLSVLSRVSVEPIFEDSTVYVLDSKLDSPSGPVSPSNISQLPPPRSSIQTTWTGAYHLHLGHLAPAGGFVQVRNARGTISVPATDSIVKRNTTDTSLNFGVAPTIHLGDNVVTFNTGIQGTIRRDSLAPVQMDQNLFRVFTYMSTSSFFNAVSANGYFVRDTGPFTNTPLHERQLAAALNFIVGAPWGNTHLITGWGLNDQKFTSSKLGNSENYFTSSYIGLSHRFGTHLSLKAIVEDVRSWRVVPYSPLHSAIAQGLRPAGTIDISPSRHWRIQLSSAYESTRGFHVYDLTQNAFAVSYTRPFGRRFNDKKGIFRIEFPIRFTAGVQEQTFLNFTQGQNTQLRPYIGIRIF